MSINRKEVLELLSAGKISTAEAADLLNEATAVTTPEPISVPEKPKTNGNSPSMFRVRVRNLETGKNKVSVNIPVRMLTFGLRLGSRFTSELDGLDLDELNGLMTDMESGMLVEVEDEKSNEHVQVYFE